MAIINITDKSQVPDGDQFKGSDPTESFDVSLGEDGDKSKAINKLRMPSNDGSYFGGQLAPNDNGGYNPALPANKLKTATFIAMLGANVSTSIYSGEFDLKPIDIHSLNQILVANPDPAGPITQTALNIIKSLVDGLTLSEAIIVNAKADFNLNIFDGITLSDIVSQIKNTIPQNFNISISDGLKISDVATRTFSALGPLGETGSIFSWGRNLFGEIGSGKPGGTIQTTPLQMTNRGDLSALALIDSGGSNFAFIDGLGGAFITGKNTSGQMGDGTITARVLPHFLGIGWRKITFGDIHSLGIKSDGTLWSWGGNNFGQLGHGDLVDRTVPTQIGVDTNWTDIACADSDSCAINSLGEMWRWGSNVKGQCADGTTSTLTSPTNVISGKFWVKADGGDNAFLAQDSTGQIWGSGKNSQGQMGNGIVSVDVHGLSACLLPTTVSKFRIQGTTAAALDGTNVFTWGDGTQGALGDGTNGVNATPAINFVGAKDISVANNAVHVIKTDGTLWFTGWNIYGIKGDGTSGTTQNVFTQVGNKNSWKEMYSSIWSVVAVDSSVTYSGALFSWGDNVNGKLGNGLTVGISQSPQNIDPVNRNSIYANYNNVHSSSAVVIRDDNLTYVSGLNTQGELGDGTVVPKSSFVASDMNQWRYAAINDQRSFRIGTDGQLYGAGTDGTFGAFGNGLTSVSYSTPTLIPTASDIVNVATGEHRSTYINSEGALYTCGRGNLGALGHGDLLDRPTWTRVPDTVPKKYWVKAAHTTNQTLYALASDGTLWGCGNNTAGELGDGTTTSVSSLKQIDTNVKNIAVGMSHINYVKNDGTLWSTGWNDAGQCLDGTIVNVLSPVQEDTLSTDWVNVRNNTKTVYALNSSGEVWVGGENQFGEFADPTSVVGTNRSSLRLSNSLINIDDIFGVLNGAYAIQKMSQLTTFGENAFAQLLDGTTTNSNNPTVNDSNYNWKYVSAGVDSIHVIKYDGTLWSGGRNSHGQCALGFSGPNITSLTQESTGRTDIIQISSGNGFFCALTSGGAAYSSGTSVAGELGIGILASTVNILTLVVGGHKFKQVDCKTTHTIAVDDNNIAWAWGRGTEGELGDGLATNNGTPVQVIGGPWKAIGVGHFHNLAIELSTNKLWAWGDNSFNQLGDGTAIQRNSPVQIGIKNWRKVAAGYFHSAAIDDTGALYTWGTRASGCLMDGSTVGTVLTPTQVGTDTDWVDVVCGRDNTIAKKSDGSVWVAGRNILGSLGDGTFIDKTVKTFVPYTYKQLSIAKETSIYI